jgi:hypothetical protein
MISHFIVTIICIALIYVVSAIAAKYELDEFEQSQESEDEHSPYA